jgi:hypothetical protein
MRWRPLLWLCLSLSFFVAALYFWRLGEKWRTEKNASRQATLDTQLAAPKSNGGGSAFGPLLTRSGTLNSGAASVPASANAATNAAKPSRFANRLSNTTKTLGQLTRSGNAILLENALLDTAQPLALSIPDHLRAQGDPGTYIVQSRGTLDNAFREGLKQAGATIVSYIPNNAYLVRASAQAANDLQGQPQTQTVLPYEPYYKLSSQAAPSELSLLDIAVQQKPLPQTSILNVLVFPDARDEAIGQLAALGAEIMDEQPSPFGALFKVAPAANSLSAVASLTSVQRIELSHQRSMANDLSRAKIGVAVGSRATNNYLGLSGSTSMTLVWMPHTRTSQAAFFSMFPSVALIPTAMGLTLPVLSRAAA